MKKDRSVRRTFPLAMLVALALIGFTGCEWEGSGDGDYWSAKYAFIDFSGVYRAAQGNSIILSYEVADADSGMANRENETVATGDGNRFAFSGVLESRPVVPGSLTITAGGFHLVDNGDGTMTGNDDAVGSIAYGTGSWSIDTRGFPVGAGVAILATYRYMTSGGGGGSTLPSGVKPIYQFTVQQTGNQVRLVDNYGHVYAGKLAAVDTVGDARPGAQDGVETETSTQIDQRFSFSAEGVAFGRKVVIIGSFRAYQTIYFTRNIVRDAADQIISSQMTELYRIASYFLQGTWTDAAGHTGRLEATGPANQRIQIVEQ